MDDEEIIRVIVRNMLTELDYEVAFAENGEAAIEQLVRIRNADSSFDAVIVDLTIRNGMDGLECMKKLLEIDPGIRGIISSGYCDDPALTNYRELGFRGIIAKPYQMEDLSKVLSEVIRAPEN